MIELSGYKPDLDIEIKITGLRPGEKLFEELRHTGESHEPTEHPRIFKLRAEPVIDDVEAWLGELRAAATRTPQAAKLAMKRLVPEYTPFEDQGVPSNAVIEPAASEPTRQTTEGAGRDANCAAVLK